jgi:signal transduction histidine kinase
MGGRVIPWWPSRVPFRLRVFFRGAFLSLAIATVALALSVLQEEKQLSYRSYRDVFRKNVEQITARLRHPTGQIALLNPAVPDAAVTPLRPLVLPFSAIDFDDKAKAQQAVEMAGCMVQYPDHAQLCVAVGSNPVAGGFIYAVGVFASGPLVEHSIGDLDLSRAHRLRVQVSMRGHAYRWLAPLESAAAAHSKGVTGRLTGFVEDDEGRLARKPNKEFRGWLWQDARCLEDASTTAPAASDCRKRSFFSVRLPVDLFRDELYQNPHIVWPPTDLGQVRVHVQALAPGEAKPLFDSNLEGASAPFTLSDLRSQLLVGEKLRIRRLGALETNDIISLVGGGDAEARPSRLLSGVIRRLPVEGYDRPLEAREIVTTPVGDYELLLTGDVRGVDRSLGLVATRISWFVGAMLAAIMLTWIAIEMRIIRRITLLTTRAASVKKSVHASEGLIQLNLQDLRGRDELGLLAGVLSDLLQRINEDVKREQIRAEQEKDMWHAVGHEILSPLQSLMALHAAPGDPSLRYIRRMRQAVKVLYGGASPSEAILSATLQVSTLDINGFLRHVAANAAHAGIERVLFEDAGEPVIVKAEEHSLEDVLTHVLSNADRYRSPGSPIRITLRRTADTAEVRVHNEGPAIDDALLRKIFEYGVSDAADSGALGNRGQGLFVAKTYMAKMGGTIEAHNVDGGVALVLTLAVASVEGAQNAGT